MAIKNTTKRILMGLAAIIALFLGFVAMQPAEYMISREITIQASAEKIFPYLNNSKLMKSWSPWVEFDPEAKMSFSGPDEGVGSRTSWEAGKKLGIGSATIISSIPTKRVLVQLDYVKPYVMSQEAEYFVDGAGNQSTVVWSVRGKNTFPGRIMCIFMNMDKMVGGMFEKGLLNLKNLAEKK